MKVASVADIERDWTFDDVWMANEVLDAIEDAEAGAMQRARDRAERSRPR
jgi:hypothetical protein